MESSVLIAILILLILCFALMLAWVAAKFECDTSLKLTLLPQQPDSTRRDIRVEAGEDRFILSLRTEAEAEKTLRPPAPDGAADPE